MNRKIVLCTGGFDPLHSGHIKYFQEAKKLGDILIIGVNSDSWLTRKKGMAFLSFEDRKNIIESIKDVNQVIAFNDDDNSSLDAIKQVRTEYPNDTIIFANGGDRTETNILEQDYIDNKVEFVFGVGGSNKLNSSSKILQEWRENKTQRPWGYYRVLYEIEGVKVKELEVNPGMSLSMQRHFHRTEEWFISRGSCVVKNLVGEKTLNKNDTHIVPCRSWHQLSNPFDQLCKIVEIQYGSICTEDDIERK